MPWRALARLPRRAQRAVSKRRPALAAKAGVPQIETFLYRSNMIEQSADTLPPKGADREARRSIVR